MHENKDIEMICISCGKRFVFFAGEQAYYKEREKKEGKNGYQPLLERRMLLGNSILIPVTITSILIIVKLLLKKNVETVQ